MWLWWIGLWDHRLIPLEMNCCGYGFGPRQGQGSPWAGMGEDAMSMNCYWRCVGMCEGRLWGLDHFGPFDRPMGLTLELGHVRGMFHGV